jgi:hypothetical protein
MFANPSDDPEGMRWVFLFALFPGAAMLYFWGIRLKVVSVDEEFLYISDYHKEIAAPLTEVIRVSEITWLNQCPVTIHLARPCEFGRKIAFMPPVRFFSFFEPEPVAKELRELARQSRFKLQRDAPANFLLSRQKL